MREEGEDGMQEEEGGMNITGRTMYIAGHRQSYQPNSLSVVND